MFAFTILKKKILGIFRLYHGIILLNSFVISSAIPEVNLIKHENTTNISTISSHTTLESSLPTSESIQASTISSSHKKTISVVTKLHNDLKSDKFYDAKHDIRLEDIFWSGSDAEPLTFSLKSNAHLSTVGNYAGKETFVKTATVVATVYVDGNSDEDQDNSCNSSKCDDPNKISDDYSPSDKRYWLLTVIFGALTDEDIPTIEEKLAKLYRIAFTRQQSYHLGLTNASIEVETTPYPANVTSTSTVNQKRSVNNSIEIRPTTILEYEKYFSNKIEKTNDGQLENSEVFNDINSSYLHNLTNRDTLAQQSSLITSSTTTSSLSNLTTAKSLMPSYEDKQNLENKPIVTNKKRIKHDEMIRHVSVMVHNISIVTEDDKDYLDGQVEAIVQNTKNSSTDHTKTNLNETEIIYTVFVNGHPVLAKVAANDMKLLTKAEVAQVLEKSVQIKAEPYLKDPQSTPLIPAATMSSDQGSAVLAILSENAYIFIACAIAIFLTILLLMGLMLAIGSADNKQKGEIKKLISREAQTYHQGPPPPTPDIEVEYPKKQSSKYLKSEHTETFKDQDETDRGRNVNTSHDSHQLRDRVSQPTQYTPPHSYSHTAFDNYAFEPDRNTFILVPSQSKRKHTKRSGSPVIYFPQSPATPPSASSYSSTSTASDVSSIYYIKKHKKDKKPNVHVIGKNLIKFDGRQYATIKKRDSDRKQKAYKKNKKKYLGSLAGNRVSSFESAVQVHSPPYDFQATDNGHSKTKKTDKHRHQDDDTNEKSDDTFETSDGKNSHFYEHIEAFNPVIIKNKQKSRDENYKVQMKNETNGKKKINKKTYEDDRKHPIKHESRQHKSQPSDRSDKNRKYKSSDSEMFITKKSHKISSPKTKQKILAETLREQLHQSDFSQSDCIDLDSSQKITPKNDFTQRDDLSIGSFLSMESIKKFPKCEVPDPLTKILDPVSITYFDHFNETEAIAAATAAARKPRIVETKVKTSNGPIMSSKPFDGNFTRSRSDATDPGVIGPAVWKMHKKQMEKQDTFSPLRDPVYKKNRYEDLVEGAIKLYSIETTERHDIETIITEEDADCMPGIILPREPRGKSAIITKDQVIFPRTSSTSIHRPFTAGTTRAGKIEIEVPLSPSKRAWASGAQSLLEHSLSAENIDIPTSITITTISTVITSSSTAISDSLNNLPSTSAVPLIDSIQKEMKKFQSSESK